MDIPVWMFLPLHYVAIALIAGSLVGLVAIAFYVLRHPEDPIEDEAARRELEAFRSIHRRSR